MGRFGILVILFTLVLRLTVCGQTSKIGGYGRWQCTAYFTYNGGSGFSIGRGMWIEKDNVQPALNFSVNGVFSRHNIGNKNRAGSRFQINAVLSPMVVMGFRRKSYYETLNSFYFGNSNAVISNFTEHLAIGTHFVLSPKSSKSLIDRKLSEENIYSNKNRTQQLVYLGVRFGNQSDRHKNPWSVKLNLYEDFMVLKQYLSFLADHFDRFYTGGGNFEFSRYGPDLKNGPLKIALYNDVYTGTFEREMFDYPDIYDLKADKFASNSSKKRRNARYVAQDPGQKLFNVGRFFGYIEFPVYNGKGDVDFLTLKQPLNVRLMLGKEGGTAGMGFQDLIHDTSLIDKINSNGDLDRFYALNKQNKSSFERLHHFYPVTKRGRWLYGISTTLGPVKTNDLNNQ
jgi:hypothetical protein